MGLRSYLHLKCAEHLGDLLFLAVDIEDVVQHKRAWLVCRMENQAARSEQHVLENVVDLFADSQIRCGETFEVAQEAVVVHQFVGADFPVIKPSHHPHDEVQHAHQ